LEEFCNAQIKNAEKNGKKYDRDSAERKFRKKDVNGDGVLTGDEAPFNSSAVSEK